MRHQLLVLSSSRRCWDTGFTLPYSSKYVTNGFKSSCISTFFYASYELLILNAMIYPHHWCPALPPVTSTMQRFKGCPFIKKLSSYMKQRTRPSSGPFIPHRL